MRKTFKPAEIAERYACDVGKVLDWLKSGALVGINVAKSAAGRPRWRIRQEDLDRFEESRSSKPAAPQSKPSRRKSQPAVHQYF